MTKIDYIDYMGLAKSLAMEADAGTLTETRLADLVRTRIPDHDGPEYSAGMHWIARNPELFGKVVQNPFAFLMTHIGIDDQIGEVPLVSPDILRLLSDEERREYVTTVCVRSRACNNGWINAAIEAGMSRETVRDIVVKSLREVQPTKQEYVGLLLLGAHERFLMDGRKAIASGQVDWFAHERGGISPWDLFDDESFLQVVEICAQRSPVGVLNAHEQLRMRLPMAVVDGLCAVAARRLDGIAGVAGACITLPIEVQLDLARCMRPDLQGTHHQATLIFSVLLSQPPAEVAMLFRELLPKIQQLTEFIRVFRIGFTLARDSSNRESAKVLTALVVEHLRGRGCVGTVEQRLYKGRKQLEVRLHGRTYVLSRKAHRYIPQVGEEVFFHPSGGVSLGPHVKAVYFHPTDGRPINWDE